MKNSDGRIEFLLSCNSDRVVRGKTVHFVMLFNVKTINISKGSHTKIKVQNF